MDINNLSAEDLSKLRAAALDRFEYNPITGNVVLKKWVNGYTKDAVGKPINSSATSSGYYNVRLLGNKFRLHRIIWLMQTGEMPDVIDHRNRVRSDNRWDNLRDRTHRNNVVNTSGYTWNIQEDILEDSVSYRIRFSLGGSHQHICSTKSREAAISIASVIRYLLLDMPNLTKEEALREVNKLYEDFISCGYAY